MGCAAKISMMWVSDRSAMPIASDAVLDMILPTLEPTDLAASEWGCRPCENPEGLQGTWSVCSARDLVRFCAAIRAQLAKNLVILEGCSRVLLLGT